MPALQLSSEQSVGDVWIAQLDRKSFTSEVQRLQKWSVHNSVRVSFCWRL